jgi:catechol 2,3-dioxygenase-like lactoylglutathione lyase family enzyme
MFKRLGAAILLVEDLEKSIVFYRDILELKIKNQSPDWVEFQNEPQGAVLALHPARIKQKGFSNMLVGFNVSNLESVCKKLEEKEVNSIRGLPRNLLENMQLLRTRRVI